jgi:hypothetical protein
MGVIHDQVNKLAEEKAYQEGGYMGLWKYRMMRLAHTIKSNSCCA